MSLRRGDDQIRGLHDRAALRPDLDASTLARLGSLNACHAVTEHEEPLLDPFAYGAFSGRVVLGAGVSRDARADEVSCLGAACAGAA
jgi:hypothetical protein